MDITTVAIQANIDALKTLLLEASIQAQEASKNMAEGQRNRAFGTLVGLEETLTKAQNPLVRLWYYTLLDGHSYG
ncbi:hypothetical protein D0962_20620 [Leptolyngbyaceae cyanobacterium CCMR0082]|uniref:Uncharacterized protein n=1 Tax=Adonisia turfae CCMR0082 TaxID=2304604 RepID=A0A6M0S9M6_9CYAN|nr:hypothetical protein [Adonisia turfae]NEZ65149.1 hypothetical protein [Adonisia turfae CCMR0082]